MISTIMNKSLLLMNSGISWLRRRRRKGLLVYARMVGRLLDYARVELRGRERSIIRSFVLWFWMRCIWASEVSCGLDYTRGDVYDGCNCWCLSKTVPFSLYVPLFLFMIRGFDQVLWYLNRLFCLSIVLLVFVQYHGLDWLVILWS